MKAILAIVAVLTAFTILAQNWGGPQPAFPNAPARQRYSGNIALTNSAARNLVTFTMPTNRYASAIIHGNVIASDGTNYQSQNAMILMDTISKSGVLTSTVTASTNSTAASSGTLSVTYSVATFNSTNIVLKVTATSSLTPTTLNWRGAVLDVETDGNYGVTFR